MVVRAGPECQSSDVGNQEPSTDQLREAFSLPLSLDVAALFINARDAGVDWESAKRAVVEGTARRFGSPDIQLRSKGRPQRVPRLWNGFVFGLLVYLAVKPALSLAREATLAAVALALQRFAASGVWQPLISVLGFDPIYSDGAFRSLGAVQMEGCRTGAATFVEA